MSTILVLVGNKHHVADVSKKQTGTDQALIASVFDITLQNNKNGDGRPYANRENNQDWTFEELAKESRTFVSPEPETFNSLLRKIKDLHSKCVNTCITCNGNRLQHVDATNLLSANKNNALELESAFFSKGFKNEKPPMKICKGNYVMIPENSHSATLMQILESKVGKGETRCQREENRQ